VIGAGGKRISAYTPSEAPISPNGSRRLISGQLVCRVLKPPSTNEASRSSAMMSGTTSCSGCHSASSGTENSPEPNPVSPRTKYAANTTPKIGRY
jgi:hypothetical protein